MPIRVRGWKLPPGRSVLDPDRPQDKVVRTDQGHPWRLLALLIAMTAVGPLSLNILAPAMPGLIVTFRADAGAVQLTLSPFLFGMAGAPPRARPPSGRLRRPPGVPGGAVT